MIIETYNTTTKKWIKREIDADDLIEISENEIEQYELSKAIEKVVDIFIAKDFSENIEIGIPES